MDHFRMRWALGMAAVVVGAYSGCTYNGNTPDTADGPRGDGGGPPDADLTMPDAREVPDAPPGTPDAPPNMPDAFVPLCPATYAQPAGGTSHYRWVLVSTNWLAAEADCEDDAGPTEIPTHLAVVDNAGERSILINGSGTTLNNQWIGGTDLASEGSAIYVTPQAGIDPLTGLNGNVAMKDCVRITSGGGYDVRDCTNGNIYVCECDGFAAEPARYPSYPNGN
jgi:hypothetical protein